MLILLKAIFRAIFYLKWNIISFVILMNDINFIFLRHKLIFYANLLQPLSRWLGNGQPYSICNVYLENIICRYCIAIIYTQLIRYSYMLLINIYIWSLWPNKVKYSKLIETMQVMPTVCGSNKPSSCHRWVINCCSILIHNRIVSV